MKLFILSFLFLLIPVHAFSATDENQLSFEGKVSAQLVRQVSVPFPIIVNKVFVGIGDNVKKKQHLLEYHLENATEKNLQRELYIAGGVIDRKSHKANLEQELLEATTKYKLSAELAGKGLGSQEENSINARRVNLIRTRLKAFNDNAQIAEQDFSYRLKELEKDLGIPVTGGQKLPKKFFMTAPIAGTVIAMSAQARPDGLLQGAAFTLGVLNPIQVQIQVHESEITKLKVDQEATVELASNEKIKLPGKITMLSWQPTNAAIAVPSFYFVWLDVANPDHILKPGYKVIVNVKSSSD